MGSDKALLTLPGSGQISFLQRLIRVMLGVCEELVLVARDALQADGYAPYVSSSVRMVVDEVPDCGPLMGIYSGLRVVDASQALVCAVDTPLLQASLLTFLLAQGGDDRLVIPVVDGLPQVLLALYPRALLPLIEERLRAGRRDPRSLLEVAATRYISEEQLRAVDPDLRSFLNVNTPEELNMLRSMLTNSSAGSNSLF
jgi:molybdopterin-guanine dinucleotide biosynthesis protein A